MKSIDFESKPHSDMLSLAANGVLWLDKYSHMYCISDTNPGGFLNSTYVPVTQGFYKQREMEIGG